MNTSRIALLLGPGLAVLAVACSSSKGSGVLTETMPAEPAEAGVPDAAHDSSSPAADPPKKDAATSEPAAGECSSEATQTACVTCCSNKHEDGAAVYFVALIDCMCLPANCAKDCEKTLCDPNNPKNADADCQACVQAKNGACAPTIESTCTAAPECVAFDSCIGNSDCPGKTN